MMGWPESMNTAINYIEDNLAGDINYTVMAEKTAFSPFHFQRMFLAVYGITPAEYARRRRLTLAATELSSGNVLVIDIAMKYGYDSPDAFTRAFRNMHGVTPTEAREPGVKLVAYPRISFNIEVTGGIDMDYRIISKPAFPVAMVSRKFTNVDGKNFIDLPKWWGEFRESPDCAALTALSGNKPGKYTNGLMLGVCYGEAETGEFYYAIAVEITRGTSTGKFEKMEIPATTWAVFDCMLPDFQEVSTKIFKDWYISTGNEHSGGLDLEVYLNMGSHNEMKCQIWAPIVKKK